MPVPSLITDLSTTAASNSPSGTDAIGTTLDDYLRGIQAILRSESLIKEWQQHPYTHTYASGTSFTISGVDVTTTYSVGRRIRAVGSVTGTIYGRITASVFGTNTTVTISWDSGSLSNETLTVSLASIKGGTSAQTIHQSGIAGGVIGTDIQAYSAVLADLASRWTAASASGAASLDFHEDTDNGTNRVRLQGAASTADVTVTLPATTGTVALTSDIPAAKALGSPVSKSENTVYQAATDGFFIGTMTCTANENTAAMIIAYSDGSNPPTTVVGGNILTGHSATNYANGLYASFCVPIKSGDYYKGNKVNQAGSGSMTATRVYTFIPFS